VPSCFSAIPASPTAAKRLLAEGSGAIAGFVDIIIEMRRYDPEQLQDTRRVLSVYSRYEPFEVVIRWNGDGEYETLGTPGAYSAEAQRELLLEALAELGTATTGELAKAVELPHSTASKRLSELEAAGRVVRSGGGRKGDPHRWSLTDGGDDDLDGDGFDSPRNTHKRGETKTDEKHHTPHQEAKNGGHGSADFFSPHNSLIRGKHHTPHREAKKTDGKPENITWLPDAKNGGHDPAGEDEKHHTWLPDAKNAVCEVCGQLFTWSGRGQPARYCSRTCQMKAYRQRQSSADTPGHGEPVSTAVVQADSGPPDPGICLDCHQPITAEGFQYRCPACLKARYDRLRREYPEKLVRWLQTHDQKEGRR
jgi:DNA-binding transcriptional ArsR family regulator